MKERPILFNAQMVRALLNCTKSQTRRVVKPQPFPSTINPPNFEDKKAGEIFLCPDMFDPKTSVFVEYEGGGRYHNMGADVFAKKHCPYGQPGDRLWVRETFAKVEGQTHPWIATDYRATYTHGDRLGDHLGIKRRWTPSIHMPREASRILLEIISVRVERLQDISEVDAIAEGISDVAFRPDDGFPICTGYMVGEDDRKTALHVSAKAAYHELWESINGPGSWAANPWVWVVEFKRVTP